MGSIHYLFLSFKWSFVILRAKAVKKQLLKIIFVNLGQKVRYCRDDAICTLSYASRTNNPLGSSATRIVVIGRYTHNCMSFFHEMMT